MRRFALLGLVVGLLAGVGCGKKVAKNPAPDSTPADDPKPAVTPTFKSTGKSTGKAKAQPGGGGGNTASGGVSVVPGGGVGVVLNPGAATGGGGGGGGLGVVRKAAKRAATENELNQIKIFIENASGATGQMPDPRVTLDALKQEAPPIAAAVEEGVIVLHPAKMREDVWAYEAKALTDGGSVIFGGNIVRMRAEELKEKLGIK